jgi:hypothetical protein
MVNQNYILYVNQHHSLRSAKVDVLQVGDTFKLKFSIPEKHLICGLILYGTPIKGDKLKNFPFKPIEKYLFEFSNIHFSIPDLEFSVEYSDYDFEVSNIEKLIPNMLYNIYTFEVTQTGILDPLVVEKENTLSGKVTWTRMSNGQYYGTLIDGFKKMSYTPQNFFLGKKGFMCELFKYSDNTIMLRTGNASGGIGILAPSDGCLTGDILSFKIYN